MRSDLNGEEHDDGGQEEEVLDDGNLQPESITASLAQLDEHMPSNPLHHLPLV